MTLPEKALSVWYAARVAEGKRPDKARVDRVREKLSDPEALLIVVRRQEPVVGMVLAEPFRTDHGRGAADVDRGHVSMVFVHPDHQGRGVGRELLGRLIAEGPWSRLSLWTRESNIRAQALYHRSGFVPTGEFGRLPQGVSMQRWERSLHRRRTGYRR